MSPLVAERIDGSDPELRKALVDALLPTDDIGDKGRSYFKIVSGGGDTVGFAGLEACDGDWLLRSVLVLPELRKRGFGTSVVEAVLDMRERDSDVFLATTDAAAFFSRLGFSEIQRKEAPPAILATRQLSSICPSSATIMKLNRFPT